MASRPGLTPSQTIGPFFEIGLLTTEQYQLVAPEVPGAICIAGTITDGRGDPVTDAMIEIWQAGPNGQYAKAGEVNDNPLSQSPFTGFGRAATDASGTYRIVTVKPGCVPWLDNRLQAPHINVSLFARGLLKRLVTRLYFPDEERANAGDPLLSSIHDMEMRKSLVASKATWGLSFHIRLQGEGETCFFEL